MVRLRRLVPLVLSAWLGASFLASAVVAPAAFAILPSRALAGALVGRVLPVLFASGAVAAVLSVLAYRSAACRRRVRAAAWLLGVAMLAAQFVVLPRIRAVRESAGNRLESLAQEDERRIAFGRLHGVSLMLLGIGVLSALVLVVEGSRASPAGSG
ncbi:MAG: hypothetical protein MNPFHGCM_03139 [Gemmatimonadaceae bacterium]|nr:hypothetical protein [Gemmatimonadaceae bacterium]